MIGFRCALLFLFGAAFAAASERATQLVQQALAAEARLDSHTALARLLEAEALRPQDAAILQKIARQYADLTYDTADEAERKKLSLQALDYARRAADLSPGNAVNQLSLAICYGRLALYSDVRTKVAYSRLVKEHAERTLALDPGYDYAHHVLGRWHYEIASLGAPKRWLVKLIYGGLPPASTAEAVRHLRRAAELNPLAASHQVELGFALLADNQPDAALAAFTRALELPVREKHDPAALRRAREAVAELAAGRR